MIEMEDVNLLILNKNELEEAINDRIAVIYRLSEPDCYYDNNVRSAIKPDEHKNYKIYKYLTYLVISSKHFFKIENGKLVQIHAFS